MTRVKIKGGRKSYRVQTSKRQRDETLSASTDSTSPTTMITLKQERPSQEEEEEEEGKAGGAAALPSGPFLTTSEKRDIPEPRPIEEMLLDHPSRSLQISSWLIEMELLLFSPQHSSHETTARRLAHDHTRDSKLTAL